MPDKMEIGSMFLTIEPCSNAVEHTTYYNPHQEIDIRIMDKLWNKEDGHPTHCHIDG